LAQFDLAGALRWARPIIGRETLSRRTAAQLPFVDAAIAGAPLLLDTTVYIDELQGRTPQNIHDLVRLRQINHSTVALAEMLHTLGRLDPLHPDTTMAANQIATLLGAIRPHRLFQPDADIVGRAAILAGVLCRIQNYAKDDRLRALNDCTVFLQAQKLGYSVLTRNIRDYDYLLQLMPQARVLLYRRE
jgi:hypothetical protein